MFKKEEISVKDCQVIGPYSQAVKFGNLIFVSGQVALNPKTNNIIDGDIKVQTKEIFNRLEKILEAAGASLNDILKVNVYLKSMGDFPAMNEVYATYFQKPYPARATVEVARLPKGALIEVDCIAFTKSGKDNL